MGYFKKKPDYEMAEFVVFFCATLALGVLAIWRVYVFLDQL